MKIIPAFATLLATAGLLLSGCNYDIPLTAKPTRKLDLRLLGDWVSVEKDNAEEEQMHVRQFDDFTFVASIDKDIYRAFHSDFAGTAFLSVQDINGTDRLYLYMTYEFSADGKQLTLRTVSTKAVPEETRGRGALQKLIKRQLTNPKLLGDPLVFTRKSR